MTLIEMWVPHQQDFRVLRGTNAGMKHPLLHFFPTVIEMGDVDWAGL